MTSPFTEQFTGLYATPELVGRKDILEKFKRILRDPSTSPHLVFLHGVGGIGKTRLLQKALEMASRLTDGRVAHGVLDFYHIMLHTPLGLTNAIFEILTPPSLDCFQSYQQAYKVLNRARLSGNVIKLDDLRQDALKKFEDDLKLLSESGHVTLALDTAERAVYGLSGWSDEIPLAEAWKWLIEKLPAWQNVTIFVAGRDEARPAIEQMKTQTSVQVEEISVGSFNLDESLEYFEEVAKLLETKREYQFAERLKNFPLDFKKSAHAYSQGRPILLALLVDYLSFPGENEIIEMFRQFLSKKLNEEDYHRYEEVLFERLRQGEMGETLVALGRVPKGADDKLLAALLDISRPEAQKRLKQVQNLSVVKIRPEDQRVFLHDEMYELLQRHIYTWPYDASTQKIAFESIKKYYQDKRDACIRRLTELYAPVEEEGRENLELERVNEAYIERQTILSEMMFYFLRQDFDRGFRHYYRYSQEAIYSNDILMDMHLQSEILNFLVRLSDEGIKRQIEGELPPQMLLAMLRLRPVMRYWAESKYEDAINEAERLQKQISNSWTNTFPTVLAALHVWISYAYGMRSKGTDLKKADEHLKKALSLFPNEILESMTKLDNAFQWENDKHSLTEVWYVGACLALAYRVRGYLFRVKGYPQQAIDDYRRAIRLLNNLDIRVEKATALNDNGFALATQGKWQDGRSLVRNALELRRELGHRSPVAFSLNTLAMIDVYEGQYDSAQKNAERALAIFRARYDERGKGLALIALSESRRRYAVTNLILEPERRIDLIRQAHDHAEEAVTIFSQNIDEPPRKVEALIELGCACRDWVRLRTTYPNPSDNIKRLIDKAEEALVQAYDESKKEDIQYRAIDALVNLAWLRYYVFEREPNDVIDDDHPLSQAIKLAHENIPPEYFFHNGELSIDRNNAQKEIWPQIGKLYLLEGHIAYYQFDGLPKSEKKEFVASGHSEKIQKILGDIAKKYADGLQYSALYEKDYRGIRSAKDRIYAKLILLNPVEMRVVCKKIREMYPTGSVIEDLLQDRVLWLADSSQKR